ncbi:MULTISPECIES: hypothetical protein [unclassified Arthrobacter]|uniref:hypothetical protein n=1 Tax=unclassified Arthrobacter TaxID=235627 RepID=UPI001D147FAF|nr:MULTISPECIES: hypothetical protein [unclassified Arthrobacter]MCC3275976.1 hypothetical protein [Arthrobacter sp. zg-Y20]MCC3278043.1 hypothetical protein [Arthrobacter sp. zg-Y40]MCC9176439.1 hypothetical protein [Arthrobacter sp. zg-Y750]MDK1316133.1 hypothetical protein [Arthrobacter sp. zg.Y20]MDK1326859.1 hypothetical protein [Arthrobacter sp. zg-Y1143]
MSEIFLDRFRALVPKYLEDNWREEDGIPEHELDAMLAAHDFNIPLVLREFYLAVGGCEDLMEAFHFFWDPDELEIEDGYLLFLEDEDEKFVWGIREDQLDVPDPIVWRRNNARGDWQSEEGTLSEYVLDMFEWIFEEDEDED